MFDGEMGNRIMERRIGGVCSIVEVYVARNNEIMGQGSEPDPGNQSVWETEKKNGLHIPFILCANT